MQLLNKILEAASGHNRYIVAIAGPPGSGKSTLALELSQNLPDCKVLSMDGFHYDNAVLDKLGLRARKGAPETFDYPGFALTLKRVRNCEENIAIPVFDRSIDLARAAADLIIQDTKIILVEGNYLLLDESPWSQLSQYFDLSIFLDIPKSELQTRLTQRWLHHGLTPEQAHHWVTSNDMPNVDRVLNSRATPESLLSLNPSALANALE